MDDVDTNGEYRRNVKSIWSGQFLYFFTRGFYNVEFLSITFSMHMQEKRAIMFYRAMETRQDNILDIRRQE